MIDPKINAKMSDKLKKEILSYLKIRKIIDENITSLEEVDEKDWKKIWKEIRDDYSTRPFYNYPISPIQNFKDLMNLVLIVIIIYCAFTVSLLYQIIINPWKLIDNLYDSIWVIILFVMIGWLLGTIYYYMREKEKYPI